jgi:hypothetical protein
MAELTQIIMGVMATTEIITTEIMGIGIIIIMMMMTNMPKILIILIITTTETMAITEIGATITTEIMAGTMEIAELGVMEDVKCQ